MTDTTETQAVNGETPKDIQKAVRRMSADHKRLSQGRKSVESLPLDESLRRAEAVLFAAGQPVRASEISDMLPPGSDVADVLMRLKAVYDGRGVNLVEVGGRWRFQTASDLGFLFRDRQQVSRTLSRAAIETLAIIAYNQPVTRAGIEHVRGVALSKTTLDMLMDTGLIRIKGRKNAPGRPITLVTTDAFLEHFGLASLDDLPGRAAFEREGLLSDAVPDGVVGPPVPRKGSMPFANTGTDPEAGPGFVTDFLDDGKTA